MPPIQRNSFDVRDLLRALGVEPMPVISWQIGAAVRDAYFTRHQRLPEKELRTKTAGTGSHCFAVYPSGFWSEAMEIAETVILTRKAEAARQFEMFPSNKG